MKYNLKNKFVKLALVASVATYSVAVHAQGVTPVDPNTLTAPVGGITVNAYEKEVEEVKSPNYDALKQKGDVEVEVEQKFIDAPKAPNAPAVVQPVTPQAPVAVSPAVNAPVSTAPAQPASLNAPVNNVPASQPAGTNLPRSLSGNYNNGFVGGAAPVQTAPAQQDYIQIDENEQPVTQQPTEQPVQPLQDDSSLGKKKLLDNASEEETVNSDQFLTETEFKKQYAGHSPSSSEWTMENLLAVAYEKNPDINSAREAVKAVDEGVPQAISGFLPKLDFNYGKDYTKSGTSGGPDATFYPDSKSLDLTQGVFGGGESYFAVKSAQNRSLSARSELKATEQQFLLDAINAYIQYIYSQKVLGLARNNETVLSEQLRASQERFVVGDSTKTDVAQSESRLANATSNRVLIEGDYINAKAEFERIFGKGIEGDLPMPNTLPDIPASLEDALDLAYNNNPSLKQLKYLVESRDNDVAVQRSQLLPQVDVQGSIAERESVTGNTLFDTESQTVGLNVRVPIYEGGLVYSRTREARDVRNQTQQQYYNTKRNVKNSTVQSWQALSTTASNIEATKSSLAASEFALEGVREEQKEGARTILDVLDAEQERFTAEISHARAIKDSVIAVYTLKSVLGELTPSELNLPVKEYDAEEHYKNTRFKFIGL